MSRDDDGVWDVIDFDLFSGPRRIQFWVGFKPWWLGWAGLFGKFSFNGHVGKYVKTNLPT